MFKKKTKKALDIFKTGNVNTSAGNFTSYTVSAFPYSPVALVELSNEYVGNDVAVVELEADIPGFGRRNFRGEAKRDPQDRNNPELAYALATARAFKSLANRLEKRANGLLKHEEDLLATKKIQQAKAKRKAAAAKAAATRAAKKRV